VHLRQRLLLLPQQSALHLVVEPHIIPLLLLGRVGLGLHAYGVEETGHFLAFFFELVAGDHESLGDVGVQVPLVTLSQHLINAGYVALLLRQQR
jgi:hypothetical protein